MPAGRRRGFGDLGEGVLDHLAPDGQIPIVAVGLPAPCEHTHVPVGENIDGDALVGAIVFSYGWRDRHKIIECLLDRPGDGIRRWLVGGLDPLRDHPAIGVNERGDTLDAVVFGRLEHVARRAALLHRTLDKLAGRVGQFARLLDLEAGKHWRVAEQAAGGGDLHGMVESAPAEAEGSGRFLVAAVLFARGYAATEFVVAQRGCRHARTPTAAETRAGARP